LLPQKGGALSLKYGLIGQVFSLHTVELKEQSRL
jgi:hypothetical protein